MTGVFGGTRPCQRGLPDELGWKGTETLKMALPSQRGNPLLSPPFDGCVAQLVEQRTENPRVAGSIPAAATILSPTIDAGALPAFQRVAHFL
jgi:hypothetical protein